MRRPGSVSSLEDLGRIRLSENFFMRDMLYSEIANFYGIANIPDDPDLTVEVGKRLCQEILEPIWAKLGRISIRSAYRSCAVNQAGIGKHNCASNESNYAGHIWDRRDKHGMMGATACVVVHSYLPYFERTRDWQALAWWLHDNVPQNGGITFYPKLAAFNISWYEKPERSIYSFAAPKGWLTKPGMDNYEGSHVEAYRAWIEELGGGSVNIDKIVSSLPTMSHQERDRVRANAEKLRESTNPAQHSAAEKMIEALDGIEASEHEALVDRLNGMQVAARVIEAFRVSPMTETEGKIIQVLLDKPNSTSAELSQALGWGAQSWHMHFGTMCFNRAVYLWPAPKSQKRPNDFYSGILADLSAEYRWTMKPDVEAAFSELGLHANG